MKYEMINCPECGGVSEEDKMTIVCQNGMYCESPCENCNASPEDYYNVLESCHKCNEGKIKSDYLIITDSVEKILFKDYEIFEPRERLDDGTVEKWYDDLIVFDEGLFGIEDYLFTDKPFKVHKSIVKEVCEPKEDDAIFYWKKYDGVTLHELDDFPEYFNCISDLIHLVIDIKDIEYIKANPLSISKTIGELRELMQ